MVAGAGLPWLLTGCPYAEQAAQPPSSHPALTTPEDHCVVALLDRAVTGPAAGTALAELARRGRRVAGASVTVGVGESFFQRASLTGRQPRQLTAMPAFPGDLLDAQRSHGDVIVQVGAASSGDADSALRKLVSGLRGMSVRWHAAGVRPENAMAHGRAMTRNPFGFTEGHGNPDSRSTAATDRVVLVGPGAGEPAWAVGGSYLVLRVVRLSTALWDADPIEVQERIIGRRRDGTWLDGTVATAEPDFGADPAGAVTPLDSHVRRAHPRQSGTPAPRLLRRSWSYSQETAPGQAEDGLLFMCYQTDLQAGFLAVQHRLKGEAMMQYTLTVGGGYYFVPPPDRGQGRWEDSLLA